MFTIVYFIIDERMVFMVGIKIQGSVCTLHSLDGRMILSFLNIFLICFCIFKLDSIHTTAVVTSDFFSSLTVLSRSVAPGHPLVGFTLCYLLSVSNGAIM
jgi:hypothetical protein